MEWIASGARVAAAAGRRGVLVARLPGVIAGGSRWSASASAAAASTGAAVKLSAKVPVRFKDKLPSADKPPCVILHGMLGSASNWRGLLARGDLFASDQYIAAVDLRNHGSSEHASTMTYPEMCKDVIEYSRMLGVDKAHIIGHSMGGKVAMTLALTHPEQVASLVVVDIAPVNYTKTLMHTSIMDAMSQLDLSKVESVSAARSLLTDAIPCPMTREFVLTNLVSNPGGDTHLRWKVNLPVLRAGILEGDLSLFSLPTDGAVYDGPCLFIRGGTSAYIQDEHLETIATLFPNSVVKTIEGAGHWVHHEKQNEFVAVLKEFYSNSVFL